MTENNAAQPGLTDDEINDLCGWRASNTTMRAENDRALARAVESALLSKLRAEGVQAGDERAALAWYAEQVAGCRKIGADGDAARQALDKDGGRRARAALESATVADESPMAKMADALREKGRQEQQAYQDSRVQSTEWGPMPHGTEADLPASAPVAGEAVLRIYAEGSARTVTEWLDGARDLPDGDHKLYAAPQASEAVRGAGIAESEDVMLPPLPEALALQPGQLGYSGQTLDCFARASVIADRQRRAALSAQPGAQRTGGGDAE